MLFLSFLLVVAYSCKAGLLAVAVMKSKHLLRTVLEQEVQVVAATLVPRLGSHVFGAHRHGVARIHILIKLFGPKYLLNGVVRLFFILAFSHCEKMTGIPWPVWLSG